MTNETQLCSELHKAYCDLTGMRVDLTLQRTFMWQAWKLKGWTVCDLALVIRFLQKKIRAGQKWESSLSFRRLIEDTEGFEENLSMARAAARGPKQDRERQSVLCATGRCGQAQPEPARSAGQIMAERSQLADMLAKFKESL